MVSHACNFCSFNSNSKVGLDSMQIELEQVVLARATCPTTGALLTRSSPESGNPKNSAHAGLDLDWSSWLLCLRFFGWGGEDQKRGGSDGPH